MATRRIHMHPGSVLAGGLVFAPPMGVPQDDTDGIISAVSVPDWSAISDSDVLTVASTQLVQANAPVYQSLFVSKIDNAGTDFQVTFTIIGKNQWWETVSEQVAMTGAGTETAATSYCYAFVDSITIDTIVANLAADSLLLGWAKNVASTEARFALPAKLHAATDLLAVNTLSAAVNGAIFSPVKDVQLDPYYNYRLDPAATLAGTLSATLMPIMNPLTSDII